MNGKLASLFFILGIAFLLLAIFGKPLLHTIKSKIDAVEYADDGYEPDDYSDKDFIDTQNKVTPPPQPPPPPPRKNINERVFDFAEIAPEYPGGITALRKEVQKAYTIPRNYKNSGEKGGNIIVRFVVQKDGSIGQIKVLKGLQNCDECSEEAIRAIKSLKKKFEPGKQAGVPVAVRYTLPIVIVIR